MATAINDATATHGFTARVDGDSVVITSGTAGLGGNAALLSIGNITKTTGAATVTAEITDVTLGAAPIAARGELDFEYFIGDTNVTASYNEGTISLGNISVEIDTSAFVIGSEQEMEVVGTDEVYTWASTTMVEQGTELTLQVGANAGKTQTIGVSVTGISTDILGLTVGLVTDDLSGPPSDDEVRARSLLLNVIGDTEVQIVNGEEMDANASGRHAISLIDKALSTVSEQRSALGAVQNRLEFAINNLDTAAENLQAAETRIRDMDMAKGMIEFTKNQILTQAATAMLAQANQMPQTVLQLLR